MFVEEKNVILNEVIDEKIYQQAKKNMCKEDDYFSEKELKILYNIRRNLGETYMKKCVFL